MNIHDIENHIDPTILYRGAGYYQGGAVLTLEELAGGAWKALVQGSRTYKTKVRLADEKVVASKCDCPYDWGDYCKHEVAVMLAIRDKVWGEGDVEKEGQPDSSVAQKAKKKSTIRQLAKGIKKEELVDFLDEMAREYTNLREMFLLRFAPTAQPGRESKAREVRLDYRKMIRQAAEDPDDDWGHFVDEYELHLALEKILVRARKLEEEENYQELLEICRVIVEELAEMIERIEEDSSGVMESVEEAIEMLGRIAVKREKPEAAAAMDFLLEWLMSKSSRGWEFDEEIWSEMKGMGLNAAEQQRMETVLKSAVSLALQSKSEWNQEKWIGRLAIFLALYRSIEDSEAFLVQYVSLSGIRERLVRREMEEGRYGTARNLLREGIEVAYAKSHWGTVRTWQEMLLEIAVLDEDDAAVRVLREQLFYSNGSYDFNQYDALKAAHSPDKWPEKVEKLIAGIAEDQGTLFWRKPALVSEILYREQYYNRLVEHLKAEPLEYGILARFWEGLRGSHPEFLKEGLSQVIREQAVEAGDRSRYRSLAGMLGKLSELPGGKTAANALREELIRTFPRRFAMVEELNGGRKQR